MGVFLTCDFKINAVAKQIWMERCRLHHWKDFSKYFKDLMS